MKKNDNKRKKKIEANRSFYVYGTQPVIELLKSNHPVEQIVIAKETDPRIKRQIDYLIQDKNLELKTVPKQQVQRYTGPVVHQGIAAQIKTFHYHQQDNLFDILLKSDKILIVILDQIQDTHNLGAIIRTAEIAGATCIVIPEKGSALVNNTVAKTSAGAVFHIPIVLCPDLFLLIDRLKSNNVQIFVAEEGRQNNMYEAKFNTNLALIIGSEGKGVRKNLKKLADWIISIPQFGKVNSLNASVSAAIILYEIIRQRKFTEY